MNADARCKPTEHQISRRTVLGGAGGLMLGGLAQPMLAEALKQKDRQVLFVWLDGGMSQLESWDPKPDTRFGGPFRAIPTSVKGTHISELLPETAKQMHRLAIVRSLCTQDNSHSAGVDRIQRGDPQNRGVVYPYFGSAVAKLLGPTPTGLPPYVWIKPGGGGFMPKDAGFLGPKYGALAFGDGQPPANLLRHESVSAEDDQQRQTLRERFNQRYAATHRPAFGEANTYVYDMAQKLMARQDLFDSSKVPLRDVQRYGQHDLGRHLLVARRMLEAGVRFVKVNSYGWDTHGDNFNAHASLVSKFDQGFSALIEDLAVTGMLDHVLVVVLSEFGRTPRINGHVGRDHWPEAWSCCMAGCGIHKGVVVGKTNDEGTFVDTMPYDIGDLFHTWFNALGIDSIKAEYHNGSQPLPIAHEVRSPIPELLA